jgi:hypothetical protein
MAGANDLPRGLDLPDEAGRGCGRAEGGEEASARNGDAAPPAPQLISLPWSGLSWRLVGCELDAEAGFNPGELIRR